MIIKYKIMGKEIDLNELREKLPSNYGKIISERAKVNVNTVYRALNPNDDLKSDKVVLSALSYLKEIQSLIN